MRKFLATCAALAILVVPAGALAAPNSAAGGVSGPAFYVDGDLYRTVGTPTDFSGTGAPASSFDTIYAIPGQRNVATAAPGDRGFNGGRWMVHGIAFDADYDDVLEAADLNDNGVLDSADEVQAALEAGVAHDTGVIRMFECPVIPLPGH